MPIWLRSGRGWSPLVYGLPYSWHKTPKVVRPNGDHIGCIGLVSALTKDKGHSHLSEQDNFGQQSVVVEEHQKFIGRATVGHEGRQDNREVKP